MSLQKCILLFPLIFFLLLFLTAIFNYNKTNEISTEDNKNTKYVLFWMDETYFGVRASGYETFNDCEVKNCFATYHKGLMPLQNFDAIIFDGASYNKNIHGAPWARKLEQKYIYWRLEPPIFGSKTQQFESFFNWTITYRAGSDIEKPETLLEKSRTNYKLPSENFVRNKTKLVAWFKPDCSENQDENRKFVENLQRFVNIDVYGTCGPLKCNRSFKECYDMIEGNYKFYLIFMNQDCEEYENEEFYAVLQRNIVPIVYGMTNFGGLPPNSVVNADRYELTQSMAIYLTFLDQNVLEYLNYFEWKKSYRVYVDKKKIMCEICKKLHDEVTSTIYFDVNKWFWGSDVENC